MIKNKVSNKQQGRDMHGGKRARERISRNQRVCFVNNNLNRMT